MAHLAVLTLSFHILTLAQAVDIYASCDPTPNSEIHVNNGLYYIKPLAYGPVIPVICSNGYTMIDPSLDLNMKSFPSLLSSWDYGKLSTNFIMTNFDDTSTFRQWWLPSTKNTNFRVAKLCQSCEQAADQSLADNVVYYSEGSNFCYTWYSLGKSHFFSRFFEFKHNILYIHVLKGILVHKK